MELREIEGARNVGAQLESVYARIGGISGRPLRDSYNFAQTLYDDFGRPYGEGFNAVVGASARAQAGPLAFYVRGEYQTSSSITNYTPAQQLRLAAYDNLPVAGVPTFPAVNRFRTIEAYVALNVNNWQLSFGQQSAWWGSTYGSSLILSDNAEAMPMLKLTRVIPYELPGIFAWLGQIRNTFFVGSMRGYNYLRGPYPDFELVGNAYQSINPQPYTWGDKLALKMTSNFEIGVSAFRAVGRQDEARYHAYLACILSPPRVTFRRTIRASDIRVSTSRIVSRSCAIGCSYMPMGWQMTSPIQFDIPGNRHGMQGCIFRSCRSCTTWTCG